MDGDRLPIRDIGSTAETSLKCLTTQVTDNIMELNTARKQINYSSYMYYNINFGYLSTKCVYQKYIQWNLTTKGL